MTTDQKYAGLSRAAQRQYLRGAAQKRGEVDMVAAGVGVSREGLWKGGFFGVACSGGEPMSVLRERLFLWDTDTSAGISELCQVRVVFRQVLNRSRCLFCQLHSPTSKGAFAWVYAASCRTWVGWFFGRVQSSSQFIDR